MPHAEDWGDEAVVRERLGGLAAHLECERRTLTWEADSPETFGAELAEFAPTFAAAREGLSSEQFEQLRAETLDLVRPPQRAASDGTLRIDADYLISVARKRG